LIECRISYWHLYDPNWALRRAHPASDYEGFAPWTVRTYRGVARRKASKILDDLCTPPSRCGTQSYDWEIERGDDEQGVNLQARVASVDVPQSLWESSRCRLMQPVKD